MSRPATSEAIAESGTAMSGVREIPAWALSLGVHAGVLFLLASMTYVSDAVDLENQITSVIDDIDEREYKFDVTVEDMIGNSSEVNTLTASKAASDVMRSDPQDSMQRELEEEILTVEAPPITEVLEPPSAELTDVIETTGTTEKTGGVEGSIDRMTLEIRNSLKERQTLVVWLFDESGSLAVRRTEIADRFENIYGQLDSMNATKKAPLKTAVVGFGQNVNFYTQQPITDVHQAVNLVKGIKDDDSGKELVFTAVDKILRKWKKFRSASDRHNCMVVIVTDERGDDYKMLEDVATFSSKLGFKIYCIGNSSPFGREKGYVTWTWKDGFQDQIPVDQGPESPRMEVLDLPFWGGRRVDSSRISSGLGPYALTRLCAETGGLYLITQDSAGPTFDSSLMKDYLPDYRPIRFYEQDRLRNGAKRALTDAAEMTRQSRVIPPALAFRADSDNTLRTEADAAQKPASVLEYRVNEIVRKLEEGEKDRAKLREPRWRAAFDLAMGRSLALQARAKGYNVMLAQMKVAPKTFEKEGNNTWILKSSSQVETGPAVRKIVKRATEYLTRVIDEHPGTPWEYLAARELEQQLGWTWQESSRNYAATGQGGGNNQVNRVLFLEEVDPKTGKKKLVKRERPNL